MHLTRSVAALALTITAGGLAALAPAAVAAPGPTTTLSVSNPAPVNPPDNVDAGIRSQLTVAGQTGLVTDVDVQLNNLSTTFAGDLDIALTGPNGKTVMLISDRCSGSDFTNVNLVFDDDSGTRVPDNAVCTAAGPFYPSEDEIDAADFPVPNAPALSAFDGVTPNGTWVLAVADDTAGDTTTITGGFTLTFQLTDEVAPTVTFAKAPKPSSKTTQKVSFTSSEAGVTFECSVDGQGFNPCTSPVKLKKLSVGKHKLEVRATDASRNRGAVATTTVKVLPKK